ncbi:branched-chain amino acid transport system ATP-binding protein [Kaistia soli DSM 19436]|uniref:Branched-chain amino acid transport system ATP-binding protein n=1 Tax=Kaistia soli DSM 19436 TaxID=1122133 RepID=A0A1M5KI72_9HYPH|nr:ABC transporter ATP-binding protein [Kaistia soli]SHG52467.1 branched-chain amino acid transport system ATP-binding protein [Kaistia soli DSM 19436]
MTPLLETSDLQTFYGDFQALFGLDFSIAEGETVAMIGANGAGKSTFLRSIAGLNTQKKGTIRFAGEDITRLRADLISRRGIALVPEGRVMFPSLTVEENLLMGLGTDRAGAWTLKKVYELFPALTSIRHSSSVRISGGQQQMVAIGRALLTNPRLLLCDEISLGLAPKITNDIYACFSEIKASGTAIMLVEQDIVRACQAADRFYCLLEGRISLTGRPADFGIEVISRSYFGTGDHHGLA